MHTRGPWEYSAERRADLLGLVRDAIGFLLHKISIRVDPLLRPVLDLDHPHPRRTNHDKVDFVRLKLVGYGEGHLATHNNSALTPRGPF